MRGSSITNVEVGISREVQSQYDDIKAVADNITSIQLLGTAENIAKIIAVEAGLPEAETVTKASDLVDNLSAEVINTLEAG